LPIRLGGREFVSLTENGERKKTKKIIRRYRRSGRNKKNTYPSPKPEDPKSRKTSSPPFGREGGKTDCQQIPGPPGREEKGRAWGIPIRHLVSSYHIFASRGRGGKYEKSKKKGSTETSGVSIRTLTEIKNRGHYSERPSRATKEKEERTGTKRSFNLLPWDNFHNVRKEREYLVTPK